MDTLKRNVAFGEIMLRLTPPGFERLLQSPQLVATFGGSEANAAVALAQLGLPTSYVTVLPQGNPVADACAGELRRFGVDTSTIVRGKGRMGVYFFEAGVNQRPSRMIYDRAESAMALAKPGDIDWDAVLQGADWFHISGITPALSQSAAELSMESVQRAKAKGLTVSCDLNYRKNLWKWGKTALQVIPDLVKLTDIVIANEEDVQMTLGLEVPVDPHTGHLDREQSRNLTEKVLAEYPQMQAVSISMRELTDGSHNRWWSCVHDRKQFLVSRVYDIAHIVDPVGAGDSFAGAFIYGWQVLASHAEALEFAVAASCLKHSTYGDFSRYTVDEVNALLKGAGSGRVQR
jgi:2-dehydro-3-deoxygluconokinase